MTPLTDAERFRRLVIYNATFLQNLLEFTGFSGVRFMDTVSCAGNTARQAVCSVFLDP